MTGNHLYDVLISDRRNDPSCFLMQDGKPDLSFQDIAEMASRMSHRLVDADLQPGDRVAVQCSKSVEMVALYLATIQAGAVFLPLNTAYTADELAYFIEDAEPKVVVCDPNSAELMSSFSKEASVLTLDPNGLGTLTTELDRWPPEFPTCPRKRDDLAALLYTSGTTGRSKGAMLSHENLASNARVLCDVWRITEHDTLIHALPIFHTHGLFVALNTSLVAGAMVHFMPAFNLDALFDALAHGTMLMGVPTFYTRMLSDPRLDADVVKGMRLFISGSAPLLAETHVAFTKRTGQQILERYGMTETNMNTSNPIDGERRPGTVGAALPGVEVRITQPDTGATLGPGQVGMIEVRGPNVFKGYWRMPQKTSEELRADGYFITGDLGQKSEDGFISIVGRSKDLIITGGYNVYPKEIEDVLNDIDGILESAVFGIPDPDFGESIVAALVPDEGADVDLNSVEPVVSTRLARFKQPRRYELVRHLPRNAMGKVQKNILRETFASTVS